MQSSRLCRGIAAVAVAAGVAGAGAGTAAASAARPAASAVSITLTTKSKLPKVTGDTLVLFRSGNDAVATISGSVTGAAAGDTATLLAEPFGATKYVPVGSPLKLGSGSAVPYSFRVTPLLATSYEVRVATSAGKKLGTSAPGTVYVTGSGAVTGSRHCRRPVCHITLHLWLKVPATAYKTEAAKHVYLYSRLRLAAKHVPALPKVLELNRKATASRPDKLHAYEFKITVRFAFDIGEHSAYRWRVNFCTRDSESADGLGLPGQHGCGKKWIKAEPAYLG
jgi:hypothetical protein